MTTSRIKPRTIRSAIVALFAVLCLPAQGASVSLVYTGQAPVLNDGTFITASVGSVITFDVIMDFTDIPTLGGGFDIIFDSSRFQFVGLVNNNIGDPDLGRDPELLDGLLESWSFGSFFSLSGPAVVGSVEFVVLPNILTGSGIIETGPTTGIGGPFICELGQCVTTIDNVEFNAFEIGVVPLPGAAWLLLSGLLALFASGKRSR